MAIKKEFVEELDSRRKTALAGGGVDKLEARRKKGLMTARDRIDNLFEAGTFMEFGMHVQHGCHNFVMEKKELPADGVVTGTGYIGDRPVAA